MRHTGLKIVLVFGVILGLFCGVSSVVHHRHLHGAWHGHSYGFRGDRHAEFEEHVAEICVQAALDVQKQQNSKSP